MGVLSKEVFDKQNDINCDVFHIWTSSCWNANLTTYYIWKLIVGSSRFLLRIYLFKMFLSIGKKDMKTIIFNFLVSELRSTMYSTTMGVLMLAAICSFRLIFGRIHYFTLLFLPGCVSGLSLLVESKSNQVLHSILYFNLVIETILRKSKISWEWETVMFMSVSGLLMHFLTNRQDKIDFTHFWFYTPPLKDINCEKYRTNCSHDKTCLDFGHQGFWKYFVLGYGVNVIKQLITRMGVIVKEPSNILRMFFNTSNLYFGSFIGSYVAINRLLTCYLPKSGMTETFHGLIAGLISGFTYAISPNIHVLVIAITTLVQILYNNFSKHLKITNHYWNRLAIFMLCQGYLVHQKFCYPKTCAPYYSKMIDACTNNLCSSVVCYSRVFDSRRSAIISDGILKTYYCLSTKGVTDVGMFLQNPYMNSTYRGYQIQNDKNFEWRYLLKALMKMVIISKQLFYEKLEPNVDCSIIHIWSKDCKTAFLSKYWAWNIISGSARFYLPIYIVKLLLTYKKNDKKTLIKNFLISEIRSIIYANGMAIGFIFSVCLLRKLLGKVYYHSILLLPGMLSGTSLLIESRQNQTLNKIIFFNSLVESIWRKIGINKKWEIVFFASFSSFLMYLLTNRKEKIDFSHLWFYTPPVMDDHEKSNDTCSHEKTCLVHFYEGCSKYFLLGYAVNVIKKVLPRMGNLVKNPSKNMWIFFSESNLYFGLFIGSYVGFYRVLTCYLTRKSNIKKKFHGLIAGLLSGLTYAFSPNLQVLVIAITTTLQMVYSYISKYLKITNHFWQSQLLFMICHGYLIQEKFFSPKTCSSYYTKMIDACTNNVYLEIYKNLIGTYFT